MTEALNPDLRPASPNRERERVVHVLRWPTEVPLLIGVVLTAALIWLVLAVSIFGLAYAAFLALFFFLSHVVFVTYVRGSAVRIGPRQFPDLHQRIAVLSARAGLPEPPEAYVMEAGTLNAFATKFLGAKIVVLFSDLLEACEGDDAARDFVIAHELGHHHAGHLRFHWLLLPGLVMPFLGSAYSRAREYTCDRYGRDLCADREGTTRGLAIVAAGGRHGREVDLEAFMEQGASLEGPWMTLGRWLAFYPQTCERVRVLEQSLSSAPTRSTGGAVGALAILAALCLVPVLLGVGLVFGMGQLARMGLDAPSSEFDSSLFDLDEEPELFEGTREEALAKIEQDFAAFSVVIGQELADGGSIVDSDELYAAWAKWRPEEDPPKDPFDGYDYGVFEDGEELVIWSVGPDGEVGTEDDVHSND